MPAKLYVMGLFKDENMTQLAVRALKGSPYELKRVNSPIPSHKLSDTLKLKKSKVGYFTLGGGIFGFIAGFCLAIFTATQWGLIVGGKPIVALIPFFIVGFEFTILFAVFGNVVGFFILARLPNYKDLKYYDERCSGEYFGILASCDPGKEDELSEFFKNKGGEVKIFGV
jgi:molybdopterin-containing oxidoreductase family membrane subunit